MHACRLCAVSLCVCMYVFVFRSLNVVSHELSIALLFLLIHQHELWQPLLTSNVSNCCVFFNYWDSLPLWCNFSVRQNNIKPHNQQKTSYNHRSTARYGARQNNFQIERLTSPRWCSADVSRCSQAPGEALAQWSLRSAPLYGGEALTGTATESSLDVAQSHHSHIIHTYSHYVHENKESWQWLFRFCTQSPRKKISGR